MNPAVCECRSSGTNPRRSSGPSGHRPVRAGKSPSRSTTLPGGLWTRSGCRWPQIPRPSLRSRRSRLDRSKFQSMKARSIFSSKDPESRGAGRSNSVPGERPLLFREAETSSPPSCHASTHFILFRRSLRASGVDALRRLARLAHPAREAHPRLVGIPPVCLPERSAANLKACCRGLYAEIGLNFPTLLPIRRAGSAGCGRAARTGTEARSDL